MKKRFVAFLSVIMALFISATTLSGCNLITKDSERDVNQVVATVKIDGYDKEDTIYKKDMIVAYLNYGYIYVQYYGYTQQKTFGMILDSLIGNRILIQTAKKEGVTLDEDEKTEVKYSAYKSVNDLLSSYEEKPETPAKDTLIEEVRTTPKNAENAVKELTLQDKKDYINKGFDVDSTEVRRAAFNKVIKLFKENALLGEDYKLGDLTTTEYFKKTLENAEESEILTKYENKIKTDARKVTLNEVKAEYDKTVNDQKEWSNADFTEALSSASATSPVLYGAFGGYGFVYNLLLGASDELTEEVNDIKANEPNLNNADYSSKRKEVLDKITVKDLRSTWILSGYDFDGTKFTGDYAPAGDNALPFKGEVKLLKEKTDDQSAEYSVKSVTEFGLSDFVNMMDSYVYGKSMTDTGESFDNLLDDDVYKVVKTSEALEGYEDRINELMFAFSTDPGSLNTYKGYIIKPAVDGANKEEFVSTFANAGRELLKMGGKSYIIVASDYGYHVMFYSEAIKQGEAVSFDDFFGANAAQDLENLLENWDDADTDTFLYSLVNTMTSSKVSKAVSDNETALVNLYRYGEKKDCVKVYKNAYADLVD